MFMSGLSILIHWSINPFYVSLLLFCIWSFVVQLKIRCDASRFLILFKIFFLWFFRVFHSCIQIASLFSSISRKNVIEMVMRWIWWNWYFNSINFSSLWAMDIVPFACVSSCENHPCFIVFTTEPFFFLC